MSVIPVARPFGCVLTVNTGSTGVFRAPVGYVFKDLYLANLADSGMKVSVSVNRDQDTFVDYNSDDLTSGLAGISFDFATPAFYWTAAGTVRWLDVGTAELRSVQVNNGGWSNFSIMVWGVAVQDPRCYG